MTAEILQHDLLVRSLFVVFFGAACFATVALLTRQALLVGYILLGTALGPYGLNYLSDPLLIEQMADVGILFLLFLLGLNLHPQDLVALFRKTLVLTVASSGIFCAVGYGFAACMGFDQPTCWVVGSAVMFSSTIIGLKLLPTTVLHHQHVGELTISIVLLQDILAIAVMLLLKSTKWQGGLGINTMLLVLFALPVLCVCVFLAERYILQYLLRKFDRFQEYIFLMAIGWCLCVAMCAEWMGLSYEIGAFVAGVSIAAGKISRFIAENLKPLRDFFLILFFCSLGASFNVSVLPQIIGPALLLVAVLSLLKPLVFRILLVWQGESPQVGWEIGVRLGQISGEFSLLIVYLARDLRLIPAVASDWLQAATILSFMCSSYAIIFNYPSPLAVKESLRRD